MPPARIACPRSSPRLRWRRGSNAQREQLDKANSDHQHREGHGIVVEPITPLCVHDTPPYSRPLVGLAGRTVQIGDEGWFQHVRRKQAFDPPRLPDRDGTSQTTWNAGRLYSSVQEVLG